jgi:hypothetical protein
MIIARAHLPGQHRKSANADGGKRGNVGRHRRREAARVTHDRATLSPFQTPSIIFVGLSPVSSPSVSAVKARQKLLWLLAALTEKSGRGIDVRVFMPGIKKEARRRLWFSYRRVAWLPGRTVSSCRHTPA